MMSRGRMTLLCMALIALVVAFFEIFGPVRFGH
jgi:hypothetical protein